MKTNISIKEGWKPNTYICPRYFLSIILYIHKVELFRGNRPGNYLEALGLSEPNMHLNSNTLNVASRLSDCRLALR